jgi:haloacetate dehalogenase
VLLPGFDRRRIQVGEVTLQVAVGGHGPPVVLLHGYPQTHVCWHAVAPRLAGEFTGGSRSSGTTGARSSVTGWP